MLCKNKLANLDFKSKEKSNVKYFFFKKKNSKKKKQKQSQNEMHECYAMQILEKQKKKQEQQRRMVTKSRAMKHKDQVRKTQLA